ncbi:MAG: ATP-dependent Clp protease proteolytic subunit [Actinobacteria bacterium]|nr:ATP-dependent Clp protease proteolytic subunit [Actinomycetota bacterium]
MSFFDLLWLLFIISAISPVFKQRILEAQRYRLLRSLEIKRNSRVIALIHRQETLSFLGLPIFRYITIEDSEEILRAIRMTPKDMPIDLILHTPGGLVLASTQIALALSKHPAKVTVFVPHYAMSGGTLIALAADEIVMDPNAVLGPVDPQLGEYPAASIVRAISKKSIDEVDDKTLILGDVAEKALSQVYEFVKKLLMEKHDEEKASEIAKILTEGKYTHDYPITADEGQKLGLNISTEVPDEIYALMQLYPQSQGLRPSVQYIPTPYRFKEGSDRPRKRL